ncbi:MAG: sulfotransferase domain-containing protein [Erythrobacter sp.]|nr:sulfotransferase domain-containing protein [Erythrobacter sp.]
MKTHTPLDGLPYYPEAKYLCVTRDPRDAFMSLPNPWGSQGILSLDEQRAWPNGRSVSSFRWRHKAHLARLDHVQLDRRAR